MNDELTKPVDLEMAKFLKHKGYSIPTVYYWQDKDLPHSSSGLKKTKNNKKMNHNKYDDFVYSAPLLDDAISWLDKKI